MTPSFSLVKSVNFSSWYTQKQKIPIFCWRLPTFLHSILPAANKEVPTGGPGDETQIPKWCCRQIALLVQCRLKSLFASSLFYWWMLRQPHIASGYILSTAAHCTGFFYLRLSGCCISPTTPIATKIVIGTTRRVITLHISTEILCTKASGKASVQYQTPPSSHIYISFCISSHAK